MSATTTKFALIYATGGDVVKTVLKTTLKTLAERVDYMLGESGENSITPSAANTKTTKVINLSRTYTTPPRVVISFGGDAAVISIAPGGATMWVDDVSTTTFTVAIQSTGIGARPFTYIVRPASGDATP